MALKKYDILKEDVKTGPRGFPGRTGAAGMIYPAAGIAVSTGTGWDTPVANNSINWNTAYGWGDHAEAGYLGGSHLTEFNHANIANGQTAYEWGDHAEAGYAPTANPTFTGNVTMPGDGIWNSGGDVGVGTLTPDSRIQASEAQNGITRIKVSNLATAGNTSVIAGFVAECRTGSASMYIYPSDYTIESFQDTFGITSGTNVPSGIYLRAAAAGAGIDFYVNGAYLTPQARMLSTGTFTISTGGLHVGGTSDPGDNNLLVDGTSVFVGNLGEAVFTSGFAGSGWQLTQSTNTLTVDNLVVRRNMTIYQLEINKISAVGGSLLISPAHGQAISVADQGSDVYRIYIDEDGTNKQIEFVQYDIIVAKKWNGVSYSTYYGRVDSINHSATYGEAYVQVTNLSGVPLAGMDFVVAGNTTTAGRQNFIYVTSTDTNNPYIDVLAGVTSTDWSGKTKVRLGNLTGITDADLGGALSGYGLYSDNIYLKGKIVASSGTIGGWTINSTYLAKDTGTAATSAGMAPSDYPFYAGSTYANRATAPFRVTPAGSLTATGIAELGTAVGQDPEDPAGKQHAVAIKGPNIYEPSIAADDGALFINILGYQAGSTYYRNTYIGNGKGDVMYQFIGSANIIKADVVTSSHYAEVCVSADQTLTSLSRPILVFPAGATADRTLTLPTKANFTTQFEAGKKTVYFPQITIINQSEYVLDIANYDGSIFVGGIAYKTFILNAKESITLLGDNYYDATYVTWWSSSYGQGGGGTATSSITLTTAPADDHSATGVKVVMTAGESLAFGDVVYFKSDGKVWKANSTSASEVPVMAMAISTATANNDVTVLLSGIARDDSWTWTVGGVVFLDIYDGSLSQTAPTGSGYTVQVLGVATHADRMYFSPSLDLLVNV